MTIRDATTTDLPAIVAIYNAAIPARTATADLEPISVESRHGWFKEHSASKRPLWVAEQEGEIRGWLSFQSFIGRPAYHVTAEISVYVMPGRQRNGYGRRLLTEAVGRAPTLGIKTLVAFIFGHNDASLGLFRKIAIAGGSGTRWYRTRPVHSRLESWPRRAKGAVNIDLDPRAS
jgi:L-amino acid N-acyltransferase YncA